MPVVIREFMRETVDIRAVYKLGYMLETPSIPHYSTFTKGQ
jgi:hypothetical protein